MAWLGKLLLPSRAILAPLEGVSDVGFRAVCGTQGAALTWTEMVRAQAIGRRNAAALALIDTHDAATLTGVQLLASTPKDLTLALNALEECAFSTHPHFIHLRAVDLNFGCPSPEVIGTGAGPALLKRRARMVELFSTLVAWRDRNRIGVLAVGAKIRLGLTAREARDGVYKRVAADAVGAGLDFLSVHARHAGQQSRDSPDWEAIRDVVDTVASSHQDASVSGTARTRMAVIANGDVRSGEDAAALMAASGADFVMIGRAAMRNPWVFSDLRDVQSVPSPRVEPEGSSKAMPLPPSGPWPVTGRWPTVAEVDAARAQWSKWARVGQGSRLKHRVFHEQNWARLKAGAESGDRSGPPLSPSTIHMI